MFREFEQKRRRERELEWKRRRERNLRTAIVDYLRSVSDEYDIYRPGNVAQYYATRSTYIETGPFGIGLVQVGPIKLFESMFRDDGEWHTTYHTLRFSYGVNKFDLESVVVEDGGYYDPAPHYLNVHPPTGHRFGKRKKGR